MEEENVGRWRENLTAMKEQLRSRLCAAHARSSFRQVPGFRGRTGVVVARVFKGNVVFIKIANTLSKKNVKKKNMSDYFPKLAKLVAGVTGGAFVLGGSAHAEATHSHTGILEELAAKKRAFFKGRTAPTLDDELKKKIREDSSAIRILRALAVPILGNVCHVFMHGFNQTEVYGLEKLQNALLYRPDGQGLVTVSNHVAAMDDPLVTASLLSPQMLLHERMLRWTLCATDRCFTSVSKSVLFTSLKVLPVSRGQGIYQEGMDLALEKLNRGDWVHIFPEGSRSRDGGKTLGNAKRGVGRLILDAEKTPLIIPFIHEGMQEVLPIGSKFPHICKKITVLVGDPIRVDDLVAKCKESELSAEELYDAIAQRIGETMQRMKAEVNQLVAEVKLEREKNRKVYLSRRATGIWEHVDWEMEGFSVQDMTEEREAESSGVTVEDSSSSVTRSCEKQEQDSHFWKRDAWQSGEEFRSITMRLKWEPAAFMSFAARGLTEGKVNEHKRC